MDITKITRGVDELGRVVLPQEMRKSLDIGEKSVVEIWVEPERKQIIIQKDSASCIYCGASDALKTYHGKSICPTCQREISVL